jgi:hypothetical protein
MHLKNGRSAVNGAYVWKGTTSRVTSKDGSTSPRNCGYQSSYFGKSFENYSPSVTAMFFFQNFKGGNRYLI